ncbi:MAG: MotA/TolQ/ExbB proton channel family protein [Pseudomonadota bacterium]
MEATQMTGFSGFLAQTDSVGMGIVVILAFMSIVTWALIVGKGILTWREKRRSKAFLDTFWNASSLSEVGSTLKDTADHTQDNLFAHLTWHGLQAVKHGGVNAKRLEDAGGGAEFLTRSLRRVIDEETARLEAGLTILASIGSTAPFVGLFGTVWGVYHALAAISLTGQSTLDKVAGPVGEALIMTAAGLAVAMPAVLAFNAFVRFNRVVLAQLDSFAHDLFSLLTMGSRVSESVVPIKNTIPKATTSLQEAS